MLRNVTFLDGINACFFWGSVQYWLKPGGKIFITDYCCGPKPWSDEFTAYVEQRGYDLLTPSEYGNIFSDLGYENVIAEDKTDMFVYYLKKELAEVEKDKDQFINVCIFFFNFQIFIYLIFFIFGF